MSETRRNLVLLLAAGLAGCGKGADHDANARKIIEPAAAFGKVALGLTGTGEQLVKRGRISLHRRVKAADGCEIDVWVIRARPPKKAGEKRPARGTAVVLHPLLTSKSWFLNLGGILADRGWDVVLPDLRAHGRSGGEYTTWGVKEKQDIKLVLDALLKEQAVSERIYACGASMGGLVAIQYAAHDPRCRGVLALAPPASARAGARRILLLESPADFEKALKRAGELAGFDPEEASAVTAAKRLRCPLRIAHGVWDFIIPYAHSEAVFQAAPAPKKFITLPLHGHAAEVLREAWVADQIDALVGMSRSQAASRPAESKTPRGTRQAVRRPTG